MGKLFILFAVMPIVEIALLVHVGDIIGGWNTIGFVLLTAFVGAYLVKREGISTLTQAQQKMQQGTMPGNEMAQGLLLVVAGVLLVTPGFVTDTVGFLFTLSPTRKLLAKYLMTKMANSQSVHASFTTNQGFHSHNPQGFRSTNNSSDDIIEGEYHEAGHSQISNHSANKPNQPD